MAVNVLAQNNGQHVAQQQRERDGPLGRRRGQPGESGCHLGENNTCLAGTMPFHEGGVLHPIHGAVDAFPAHRTRYAEGTKGRVVAHWVESRPSAPRAT